MVRIEQRAIRHSAVSAAAFAAFVGRATASPVMPV
jgi:hypothetical protein